MDGDFLQNALILDELTALLGSGRFKTLLKHLRALCPSLRAAAHQHQSCPTAAAHRQCYVVEDEGLQNDELVAEVEQRVTQLESILGRYNSRFDPVPQVSDTISMIP
jgi:hypothetical protein